MSARARAATRWQSQGALVCEGMTPDVVDEHNIGDVFDLWVERVADVNAAIAAHEVPS